MMNQNNVEELPWTHAIRKFYSNKGVRLTAQNTYEAYISFDGKMRSCGTYATAEQAREAVITARIELFEKNIRANNDNPFEVVESVEQGYFVSPIGNIYNRHGILLIGGVNRTGYKQVVVNNKTQFVHRIVAQTFIANPNNLPCINHKDGNKLNNTVDNLEWCTHSENTIHAYETGLESKVCGEQHRAHKLTEEDVKYIRRVYLKRDENFGAVALAKLLGVDRTTILDVVNNKTWREVT